MNVRANFPHASYSSITFTTRAEYSFVQVIPPSYYDTTGLEHSLSVQAEGANRKRNPVDCGRH